jgi:hypothetical protein
MMNQVAIRLSTKSYPPMTGAIGYLSLNYHEVKALEMALYFLTEQVSKTKRHAFFADLRDYHLRYISDWLNNATLRSQLRFDGKNSVAWAVMSAEDIEWLLLALEVGMTEETIISMASDEANYEQDMAMMYSEMSSDFMSHYRAFHQYYCQMAQLRPALLTQLRQMLNHHYL